MVLTLEIKLPSWHQSKRWGLLNRENLCKLDGLRTVARRKQKFFVKELLTIACKTFLQRGRLFPTSVASFWVTKFILLSQKTNVPFVQQLWPSNPAVDQNKVTTRHCGPLEARVTRVYFIRETKRNENSPQTSDFDFENLSSLQSFANG